MEDPDQTDDTDQEGGAAERAGELVGTEQMMTGKVLEAGIELGLFDMLGRDPISATDLAENVDADPEYTYRLLRAMAHVGVVEETTDRRFMLTAVGEYFQPGRPHRDPVRYYWGPELMAAWNHLPEIVADGERTGFDREFGCGAYEYLKEHPDLASAFNEFMSSLSQEETPVILDRLSEYDFTEFSHICDVAGGHGWFLCQFLDVYPNLEGTVLDIPSVIEEEDELWAPKLGVEDRCSYVGGDMFERVPEADAFFLKGILHNWSDEECEATLSSIRDASPRNGRLFVFEHLIQGPNTRQFRKLLDIHMMVWSGGRERTKSEYQSLIERGDWTVVDSWETPDGVSDVIEARAV